MNELLSIIVPVYNVEMYLKRCVDSILKQDYDNMEIILVDDGSTDSSGVICDQYASNYKNVKVIHKKNGGLSDARNFGLDNCRGQYISFIDSDDWIEYGMYHHMISQMLSDDSDISICRRNRVNENNQSRLEACRRYPSKSILTKEEGLSCLMTYTGYDMSVCDKVLKKEIINNIRFPFEKTCEDSFTTYKFFSNAKRISYINKPYYNYFYRENSITRSSKVNKAVIEASLEQMVYISNNYPTVKVEREVNYVVSVISVFNEFIKRNLDWPEKKLYSKECKLYFKSIISCQYIGSLKRFQCIAFLISPQIYRLIFKKVGGKA